MSVHFYCYRQPSKIEWRFTEDGNKVRVSVRTGRIIPIPKLAEETYDYKTKGTYKGIPCFFTIFIKI